MSDDVNEEIRRLCDRLLDLRGVCKASMGERGVFFHDVFICDAEGEFDMTLIRENEPGVEIWDSQRGVLHDAALHTLELLRKELVLERLSDV